MKTLPALIATVAAALFLAPLATAAPANDNFVSATAISSANGSQVGNNLSATKEVGEPAHAGNTGGRSIWYRVDGTRGRASTSSTRSPVRSTPARRVLGKRVAALTEVASNDDAPGLDSSRSLMVFSRDPRTWFTAVAVDGFGGKGGRVVFVGGTACRTISSTLRRRSPDSRQPRRDERQRHHRARRAESCRAGSLGLVRVDGSGERQLVKFSTRGSRFDTALAVYTGTNVASLTEVASNDDDPQLGCCASSFVGFEAVAGTTYRIAVGGFGWDQGSFTLSWSPLIIGTSGNDTLVGSFGRRGDPGLRGNDVIRGLGGADVILSGPGNDRSLGGRRK